MSGTSIFLTATEARQNPIKSRVILDEGYALQRAVLDAVADGLFSATVSDGTPMTQSTVSSILVVDIDEATGTFYIPNHDFVTGELIQISSTGSVPSPLSASKYYYVIYLDQNNIKLAYTLQDATAGRPIAITVSSGVSSIELTDQGSGYLTSPTVTLVGGDYTTPATALAYLAPYGGVSYIAVITSGSGYTDVPTVTIDAQGSGATAGTITYKAVSGAVASTGASYRLGDVLTVVGGVGTAATFTVTQVGAGGAVVAVALTNAGNYSTLPSLNSVSTSVNPSGGTGCTLNLTIGINTIAVSSGGLGYAGIPKITISGGSGSGATAVALITAGTVSGITVTNPGYGYTSAPSVDITSGAGATATAVLIPSGVGNVTITNNGGNTYTALPSVSFFPQGDGAAAAQVYMRVLSATKGTAGVGYTAGDVLLIAGGAGSNNATIQVISVGTLGQISTWVLATGGRYRQMPILQDNNVIGGSGNGATFTLNMCLDSIDLATAGSGYTSPPVVTVSSTSGYGAQVIADLNGDSVSELRVVANGTGYLTIPTITISNGTGAIAQAHLVGTSISSINLNDGGTGYVTATVDIVGDGIGATAHVEITDGVITNIVVDTAGSGYTYPPTITITGNGNGANANAVLAPTALNYISITNTGSGYTSPPSVSITGAATARADLQSTGVDRIDVVTPGENYTSTPLVNVIPSAFNQGLPIAPATSTSLGYSLSSIAVITPGSGYQSTPTVNINAPQSNLGNTAIATATIGVGQGTISITSYPASRDYYAAWKNQTVSSEDLTRPYIDRMDTVINYFTNLGYTINRQTNPTTGNTLQWYIKW